VAFVASDPCVDLVAEYLRGSSDGREDRRHDKEHQILCSHSLLISTGPVAIRYLVPLRLDYSSFRVEHNWLLLSTTVVPSCRWDRKSGPP
jgi:hypothetical protein